MVETAPPVGRAAPQELLEPLRRTLRWLSSLADERGALVCPEHRIEHTGKSACALSLALALLEHDPAADREFLRNFAIAQGRRLAGNLEREGTSPCHTFRPGRHDPFNCSNHVIDGGACCDALATLVRALGPELEPPERERFTQACLLHARTYLRYAVLDKGVPAQRAWGLSGLAAAHALAPDPELERAAFGAVEALARIQHPDGSYPYHPREWGAPHPGAADVSAFYQSRVSAFLLYALATLGLDPREEPFRGPLERGLAFLAALVGPDGIKCGLVEAKPWYWGAPTEVASNPFDAFALARGGALLGRGDWLALARRSLEAWAHLLSPAGVPASHAPLPGTRRSYQCPLFWAAHAMWFARALPQLAAAAGAEAPSPGVRWFPSAQLARLDGPGVAAWVRGARPPVNVHHGSPRGAGLLRAVRPDGEELLSRVPPALDPEAEWTGRAGHASPRRARRGARGELRFSLWLARVHLRAGRPVEALGEPLRVLREGVVAFGSTQVSSAFDLTPRVEPLPGGVRLAARLAWRDGTPVPGSRLVRTYRADEGGLAVEETLESAGVARSVRLHPPARARGLELGECRARYRLGAEGAA